MVGIVSDGMLLHAQNDVLQSEVSAVAPAANVDSNQVHGGDLIMLSPGRGPRVQHCVRHLRTKDGVGGSEFWLSYCKAMGHTFDVHLNSYARFMPYSTVDSVAALNV